MPKCSVCPLTVRATWVNKYGVAVCDSHKLLLDAFTWESRHDRQWTQIKSAMKAAK